MTHLFFKKVKRDQRSGRFIADFKPFVNPTLSKINAEGVLEGTYGVAALAAPATQRSPSASQIGPAEKTV